MRDMMRGMRSASLVITLAALSACAVHGRGGAERAPGESPAGSTQPAAPHEPPAPPAAPPRQFRLGSATTALVAQAHRQAGAGDYGQAAVTLERALRIEPDNPLLWIELGRARLGENNPVQADAMGRKALALATGDAGAQAAAWRLIAEGFRARGRDPDAYDADRRAAGLAPY